MAAASWRPRQTCRRPSTAAGHPASVARGVPTCCPSRSEPTARSVVNDGDVANPRRHGRCTGWALRVRRRSPLAAVPVLRPDTPRRLVNVPRGPLRNHWNASRRSNRIRSSPSMRSKPVPTGIASDIPHRRADPGAPSRPREVRRVASGWAARSAVPASRRAWAS